MSDDCSSLHLPAEADAPRVLVYTLNPSYYGLPQRMRHHHIRYRRKWAKR